MDDYSDLIGPAEPQLLPKRALFVREYLRDLNATQAALRAGYSPNSARFHASRMLNDPDVKAAVDAAKAERHAEVQAEATQVLRDLLDIAGADPNEIIEYRRRCCRHCHGEGFRYQRTPAEMARDRAQHKLDQARQQREATPEMPFAPRAFDEQGGLGWDPRRDPHEECPECFGEGEADVHVRDTRLLSGAARRLYAGVKITKDGIEVKMRDQDKALELLGKHLGLFIDRLEVKGQIDVAQRISAARKRAGG